MLQYWRALQFPPRLAILLTMIRKFLAEFSTFSYEMCHGIRDQSDRLRAVLDGADLFTAQQ